MEEDNERLNRMYQVIEKQAFSHKTVEKVGKEVDSMYSGKENSKISHRAYGENVPNKGGAGPQWKVVDDDFRSFGESQRLASESTELDAKKTVKFAM